jgi:membrane-bound lytic murein transglycosylase D
MPGDTLWDISRKYEGLSIEKIKQLNNLTNNKIKPGQKLIIG